MTYRIALPWPPSVNRMWRSFNGRNILSLEGRQYRQKVLATVLQAGRPKTMTGRLVVLIEVYPPDRRRRDLSNLEKGIGDGLAHAGVYKDDEQIDDLRIVRGGLRTGGEVVVTVTELEQARESK